AGRRVVSRPQWGRVPGPAPRRRLGDGAVLPQRVGPDGLSRAELEGAAEGLHSLVPDRGGGLRPDPGRMAHHGVGRSPRRRRAGDRAPQGLRHDPAEPGQWRTSVRRPVDRRGAPGGHRTPQGLGSSGEELRRPRRSRRLSRTQRLAARGRARAPAADPHEDRSRPGAACGRETDFIHPGVHPMTQTIAPTTLPTSALPPGPRSPSWWQLVRFAGDPLGLLDECHRRYGDTFTLHAAGRGRFVMLSDPEVVREVFRAGPDVLHAGEANALFKATVGRNSVLVLDGAPHARQRRVLVPPLKGERMRSFFDAMRLEALDAARSWPRDAPSPALPVMRRITLRVILR